eukprot:scaffold338389_cov32-Prasinocladus_malaysianus.AAC.2
MAHSKPGQALRDFHVLAVQQDGLTGQLSIAPRGRNCKQYEQDNYENTIETKSTMQQSYKSIQLTCAAAPHGIDVINPHDLVDRSVWVANSFGDSIIIVVVNESTPR